MEDNNIVQLLARVAEQQNELLQEIRAQKQKGSGKDFWDRLMAIGPILSAAIIACTGACFTYAYNQQQLKVQEIQTIEKFIPHLVGDEKSKRAAILAMSSLGNTQLAAKVAQIYASEGTASALQSIAQKGDTNDRKLAQDALYQTLEALADKYREANNFEEGVRTLKKELALKEAQFGQDSPELADSLAKLGALYEAHGNSELAHAELSRADSLAHKTTLNQTTIDGEQTKQLEGSEERKTSPVEPSTSENRKISVADPKRGQADTAAANRFIEPAAGEKNKGGKQPFEQYPANRPATDEARINDAQLLSAPAQAANSR